MPFQASVNAVQSPAVAGDFASTNPRSAVLAGPGGLVAGAAGVVVGLFGWVDKSDYRTTNNFGAGAPDGFVHREQQALITQYLAESSMTIPGGFGVTLMASGDYWAKNDGAAEAVPGMKVFANNANGKAQAAAAGSTISGASVTGAVAASTLSVTGSIADNVMTVTAVGSGSVVPGATLSGTGVATGTKVVRQLTGTAGGVGTYEVTPTEQTVASTTISGTYGTLTVSAVGSGALAVGDSISGTNVVAGTTITALGTGTGGTGTYVVDNNTVVSSTTITVYSATETVFNVASPAAPGELMKMSRVTGV